MAEVTVDLGRDRWMEGSSAQLVIALPVECCKELLRNPSTPLGCEHPRVRVPSAFGAEPGLILAQRRNQCDDQRPKAGGDLLEAENCPWSRRKASVSSKEGATVRVKMWRKSLISGR